MRPFVVRWGVGGKSRIKLFAEVLWAVAVCLPYQIGQRKTNAEFLH